MKIVLTEEVAGLGSAGDLVEVKDGYGRNFLLPQGKAIRATKGVEKEVASIKRAQQARAVRDLDHANEIKAQLNAARVRLTVRAGKGGRLFGSVTTAEIAAAVSQAGGPVLDKRRIQLLAPVKSTGKHQASVVLHPDVTATFAVEVLADKTAK
ncbi:MAG: 50S ribosomal protein L9 [Corynebacteriales bacterium]|nr:50S ribosomal protein L9 [Mycobacteriales bacterium]